MPAHLRPWVGKHKKQAGATYVAAVLCALLPQPGLGSHWLNWSVTSTLTYTVTPSVFMHAGPQVIDDQVPYSLEAPGVTV